MQKGQNVSTGVSQMLKDELTADIGKHILKYFVAGEVAQQLRILATHFPAPTCMNSSSREVRFWPPQAQGIHKVKTYKQAEQYYT